MLVFSYDLCSSVRTTGSFVRNLDALSDVLCLRRALRTENGQRSGYGDQDIFHAVRANLMHWIYRWVASANQRECVEAGAAQTGRTSAYLCNTGPPGGGDASLRPREYCRGEHPITRLKALLNALSDS